MRQNSLFPEFDHLELENKLKRRKFTGEIKHHFDYLIAANKELTKLFKDIKLQNDVELEKSCNSIKSIAGIMQTQALFCASILGKSNERK